MQQITKKERILSIDGLRAIACICIILMHIKANTNFTMVDFFYSNIVDSFTHLVYLFLIISGFGTCYGYLKKANDNQLNLADFYKKRYKKTLPFFASLIIITLIADFSLKNLYEGIMESTLLFGFLPNINLNVVGVAWTLGVIFAFYFIFPFLATILKKKKTAWFAFLASLVIAYICKNYFFDSSHVINFTPRHNFLYCLPFFLSGCLIYLYLDKIKNFFKNKKIISSILLMMIFALYFFIPNVALLGMESLFIKNIILNSSLLVYAIAFDPRPLKGRIIQYIGKISMELYLSQMFAFRILERTNLIYIFGNNYLSYLTTSILTIIMLIIAIEIWKKIYGTIVRKIGAKHE